MGNSGSGLPYEDVPGGEGGAGAALAGSAHWTIRAGRKIQADERGDKLEVSIFRFNKAQTEFVSLAQRNWQKLRKMRHPYIVSVLDGIDLEAELLVVTEAVTPLAAWEARQAPNGPTAEEVIWGMKCILEALDFVHVNCNTLHGYLGPHAIFVARNGDWKLGGMDFACVLAEEEDVFASSERRLEDQFRAPERRDGSWSSTFGRGAAGGKPSGAFGAMDMYGLGVLFREVRDKLSASCGLALPAGLDRCITKMVAADFKKRPVCKQILRQDVFVSGTILLMSTLNELALKPPLECMEILQGLRESAGLVSVPVCTHKVLPVVARTLRMCSADFQNRDARENCRQMVQTCTSLLALLITERKVDAASFGAVCLDAYLPLWTMSDRVVRTELLKTLKAFTEVVSAEAINAKIFDNMLTGFSDSNAKMREDTLKNLVCVVDKLEERNLQEKLVRTMSNLQSDSEPSIRTNATIFLGRIAPDIKEAIRFRVLPTVFVRAMKDGFTHCRVAGVRAAAACIDLIEVTQLCGKVMPQVCLLLLDPCQEVRELAMELLRGGLGPVGKNHLRLCRENEVASREREQKRLSAGPGSGSNPASSRPSESPGGGAGTGGASPTASTPSKGGWTSWAVDGLSKTIEKAVLVEQADAGKPPSSFSSASPSAAHTAVPANPKGMSLSKPAAPPAPSSPRGGGGHIKQRSISVFEEESTFASPMGSNGGWGDSFEVEVDLVAEEETKVAPAKSPKGAEAAGGASGWDEDDDWMNCLDDNNAAGAGAGAGAGGIPASRSNASLSSEGSAKARPIGKEKAVAAGGGSKLAKPVKSIGAKKMKIDKASDNWDDF
jgi:SCY1-like protein 1